MSRIIKLESENILCLKAISIVPGDGSMVKLTGPNDAGKTAILRCIWMALGGAKEIPADAIREGQDSGHVLLEIGDNGVVEFTARLNLKRRDNGTIRDSITLKDKKGRTISSPMALLRDMLGFGRGQFDPLAFRDAKADQQVEMLQTALGLDFSELDQEYSDQYDERTIVNRQATQLASQIGEKVDDPDAPDTEVSVVELADQHAAALEIKASNERHTLKITLAKQAAEQSIEECKVLVAQAEELGETIKALVASIEIDNAAIDSLEAEPLSEVPNVDAIAEKIANAESENTRARAKITRKEQINELRDFKAKSEVFTTNMATIKATRDKMIADADFPIPGVVIEDKQILVNGHPLANQGGAAQLRFGALLVMKSDPKLRIITIDEALGKLDDESLEMLDVLLTEHNFQALITGPRVVGEGCIEIRDGEIVGE